eukprot:jgi/Mesvir1/24952/Mv16925-RA.1
MGLTGTYSSQKAGDKVCFRTIEATAYCRCGRCCNWEWGLSVLSLPFYIAITGKAFPPILLRRRILDRDSASRNRDHRKRPLLARYWANAPGLSGKLYMGTTSTGAVPCEARPPILSLDSLSRPVQLLPRLLLPWRLPAQEGTIAADTDYYPFGTRMYVPGYGWGKVADRGGDIRGPNRIDLYHQHHTDALQWGRQNVKVKVVYPGYTPFWSSKMLPLPIRSITSTVAALLSQVF